MNVSQSKLEVFNDSGILKKSIDFSEISQLYGKPEAVSENGQIFLFKQDKSPIVNVVAFYIDVNAGIIDLAHIKEINIEKDIIKYAKEQT